MAEGVTAMTDWIYMTHRVTGGQTKVPDADGVRERHEALGWEVTDPIDDDAAVFVPPKAVDANEEDGWVQLYHPKTQATHLFPVHPDAIKGAYEAGWQATPPAKAPEPAKPVDDSPVAPAKKAPAKKTADSGPADEEDVTRG